LRAAHRAVSSRALFGVAFLLYGACNRNVSVRSEDDAGPVGDDATRDAGANVEETNGGVHASGGRTVVVTGCEDVAGRVVNRLPSVMRAVRDAEEAARESDGSAHFGGIGPIEDEKGFAAGLGVHTPERYEARVWYSVDRRGQLTVTVDGEDTRVPADALRAVARACGGR
jgi:hypothetical protein